VKRPISFRWLLALVYLGSVVPLLLGAGVLVYWEYREHLVDMTATHLRELVDSVVARVEASGGAASAADLEPVAVSLAMLAWTGDAQVSVLDLDGRQLAPQSSEPSRREAALHARARSTARPRLDEIDAPGGDRLAYARPVRDRSGHVVATVGASVSLAPLALELEEIRRFVALTIGGAVLVALLFAWVVGRLATRPLRGLMATAHDVAHGSFDTRAPLPSVAEPRELAVAFNLMLDHLQAAYQAEARTADQMRQFAADASHELRSPLAVLDNGVDVLRRAIRHDDPGEVERILAIMVNEVEGMAKLVDDLLFLARLERAGPETRAVLMLEPVEAVPLLEEVHARARLLATGQDLRLEWPSQPIEPIVADREMLRRALNNVVENALHHTPSGRSVTLGVVAATGGCRFVIADQGSGIVPEQLPHIFERFYRGDSARSRELPSSGLGLAIVRAIIAAHAGDVDVASEPNVGTRVEIFLPWNIQRTFSRPSGAAHVTALSSE
jgi:signal transduction histidine kinase